MEIKAASEAGDISTLLRIITKSSSLTVEDYIKKTLGSIRFMYYMYIDKMHVRPKDLIDMVDGLLYLDARTYILKQSNEK